MREVVAIGVVIGLALLGLLPGLRRVRTVLGVEHLLATGQPFLLFGVVLGPVGLGLITPNLTRDLAPVMVFLLAWVGFIVGLRLELGLLRRVTPLHLGVTALSSLLPAVGVPLALAVVPGVWEGPEALWIAGATAAGTAATAATYVLRRSHAQELTLVRVTASLDDWVIVAMTGAGFVVTRGLSAEAWAVGGLWVVGAASLGAAVVLLAPRLEQAGEELVVTIGGAALAGGMAAYLGLSAVVAGAISGLVIANLGHRRRGIRDIYDLVTRVERPFYLAFVVMAGAQLDFGTPWLWLPLTALFLLGRSLAKGLAGWAATRLSPQLRHPARVALALLPMSPLALAVAVDFSLVHPSTLAQALLVAVAVAWVLFEGVSGVFVPAVMERVPGRRS